MENSKVIKGLAATLSLSLAAVAEHFAERLWLVTSPSGNREFYHSPESLLSLVVVFIGVAIVVYKFSVRILMRMRKSGVEINSGPNWTRAGVAAALITITLFIAINWHGCWCFRREARDSLLFVFVFTWLLVFFVLQIRWRIILSIITLIALIPAVGTRFGIAEMNAAPESAAVHALHEIQSKLRSFDIEHQQKAYPDALPATTLSPSAERFYRFEYVPNRTAEGKVRSYRVEAIPARRGCGLNRSFTIANDGKIFWTLEPGAAMSTDTLLEE